MKEKIIWFVKFVVAYCAVKALASGLRVLESIAEGQKGAPSFVTPGFTIYGTIIEVVFIGAFFWLGRYIPVKNKIVRGLIFTLLFWSSDYMPQILGMAGGESTILSSDSMSFSTILVDSVGYFMKAIVLGYFLVPREPVMKRPCIKKTFVKACIVSMFLFPALLLCFELIAGRIWNEMYCIHSFGIVENSWTNFYIIFYLFQSVSGLMIPIFYRFSEYNRKDHSWVRFAAVYGIMLWLPVVLIVIFFGVNPIVTCIWGVMMVFVIFVDSFVFAKLIRESLSNGGSYERD